MSVKETVDKTKKFPLGCHFGESVIVCRGFAIGRPQIVLKQMRENRRIEEEIENRLNREETGQEGE